MLWMTLEMRKAKTAFLTTIIIYLVLTLIIHISKDEFITQLLSTHIQSVVKEVKGDMQPSSNRNQSQLYYYNESTLSPSQVKYCHNYGQHVLNASLFTKIFYNDKYKILYCSVPKVACTNWRRMFLILSGKMNTTNPIGIKSKDVHSTYVKYFTKLDGLSPEEIRYRLDNYYKFVFVREPLERVLSAYLDKLKAKNPYFHSRFGKTIAQRFRLASRKSKTEGNDVTFVEYVQYLTDFTRKEAPNEHWRRITDMCHPCIIKYDFIGTMDNMNTDSDYVLEKIGASKIVKFPKRSSLYKRPQTKTFLRQYYSRVSPAMLDQLYEVYYPDYLMFNMTVPASLKNLIAWIGKS